MSFQVPILPAKLSAVIVAANPTYQIATGVANHSATPPITDAIDTMRFVFFQGFTWSLRAHL